MNAVDPGVGLLIFPLASDGASTPGAGVKDRGSAGGERGLIWDGAAAQHALTFSRTFGTLSASGRTSPSCTRAGRPLSSAARQRRKPDRIRTNANILQRLPEPNGPSTHVIKLLKSLLLLSVLG